MSDTRQINIPLNRVEGDLEIRVEVRDGFITNAHSSGLMYRGFENIMNGRGALDGLVITPRICGICSTSHLTAAVKALNMIAGAQPPPDAIRISNLALMTEMIQSDMRHGFLMFCVDFTNPRFRHSPLYGEAVRRYEPFRGQTAVDVIRETKKVLGIIALIGGQWPHSSYMVPGGITSVPSAGDLSQCRLLVKQYRNWYERRILGCSIDQWAEIHSASDLEAWLEAKPAHSQSDLGFFIRFSREIGLDRMGAGYGNFVSYGALDLPEDTALAANTPGPQFLPSGFLQDGVLQPFDQAGVAEHVAYSWFVDYEGGRHPFDSETVPYATGLEGKKYSWAKAPRYQGLPAETGPLAQSLIAGDPLFQDLVQTGGSHVLVRELARLTRPARLIPAMEAWIMETTPEGLFYNSPGPVEEGEGFGLTDVSRGANGHWVRIIDGRISHYQIVTPTAWNASPRDSQGERGPLEEALIGVPIADPDNPVEAGLVVRSFDACLVCTVHAVSRNRTGQGLRI